MHSRGKFQTLWKEEKLKILVETSKLIEHGRVIWDWRTRRTIKKKRAAGFSLINYCSSAQQGSTCSRIYWRRLIYLLFCCCHLLQTETAAVTELTWNAKCHNFFLTYNHIIPYDDKIGPKQWDYDRVQWQNWATVWVTQACVLSNFNCTHSSPRHRRTFGPLFGTTWKLLWDLANKISTYSDIFLRTAPHHASQTFPHWETSFMVPAQMQGAEICMNIIYLIRVLNCKITIGWCVYQSKNSVSTL